MNWLTLTVLPLAGLFTIVAAANDWEWFMASSRARPLVGAFGRDGARLVYAALGLALIVGGVWLGLRER